MGIWDDVKCRRRALSTFHAFQFIKLDNECAEIHVSTAFLPGNIFMVGCDFERDGICRHYIIKVQRTTHTHTQTIQIMTAHNLYLIIKH